MTAVQDLTPGDVVELPGPTGKISAVFIQRATHPIWSHLELVVWRVTYPDGNQEWMHDALSPHQEVGEVQPANFEMRRDRLRHALLHPSQLQPGPL